MSQKCLKLQKSETMKPKSKEIESESEVLTFGSKITISLSENSDFFIASEGFVLGEVLLRNVFEVREEKVDMRDPSDCVFQILPFSSLTCFKTQEFLSQKIRSLDFFKGTSGEIQERKTALEDLNNKIWDEIISIQSIFDKMKGQPVLYESSPFLLLHINSMKILTAPKDISQSHLYFNYLGLFAYFSLDLA